MENSNVNAIAIAKKGEVVATPVETTGIIRAVRLLTFKPDKDGVIREPLFALDIEGLPSLTDEDDNKVSVLRTVSQMRTDLDYFAKPNATAQQIKMAIELYAEDKPVRLAVSAHEAGAKTVLTQYSKAVEEGHGKIGDTVAAKSAGFYIDGFMNIKFDKADIKERLRELEAASAIADNGAF